MRNYIPAALKLLSWKTWLLNPWSSVVVHVPVWNKHAEHLKS